MMESPSRSLYRLLLSFALLSFWCITRNDAALSLQQTIPSAGIAVCLHSTVQLTCSADNELIWRDLGPPLAQPISYTNLTNQITLMTGVFRTVLTDISGDTLTSTATIDSASLNDDERRISCRETDAALVTTQKIITIQVVDPPTAPTNLYVKSLTTSDTEVTVNLTWSLNHQCMVTYSVEVDTASNLMNTTSQYIVLTLQTGVVYSFRVRGADSADRGEWSELFMYTPGFSSTSTILILSTVPTFITTTTLPTSTQSGVPTGLQAGAIAGIVVGIVVVVALVLIGTFLLSFCIYKKMRPKPLPALNASHEEATMALKTLKDNDKASTGKDNDKASTGKDNDKALTGKDNDKASSIKDSQSGKNKSKPSTGKDSDKALSIKDSQSGKNKSKPSTGKDSDEALSIKDSQSGKNKSKPSKNQVEPTKQTSGITYAELELSGGSGSSGQGRETVKQDVNYEEIDHDRMNAVNSSHPPQKPPHQKRGGTT